MLRKKHLILCIFTILFSLVSLSAADIVITAEGSSRDEAIANAYDSLTSSFAVTVSSTTTISTVDDGSSSSDIMSSDVSIRSQNEFPYVNVNTVRDGKIYKTTLTIPTTAAPAYMEKLREVAAEVSYNNQLYSSLESSRDKAFNLNAQMKGYTLYSSYKTILSLLGTDTSSIQQLPSSYFAIEQQYSSVINDYANELNAAQIAYSSGDLSVSAKESREMLDQIAAQQAEVQKIKDQIAAEQKKKQDEILANSSAETSRVVQDLQALADKNRANLESKNAESATAQELIEAIEANKKEFVNLNNTLQQRINESTKRLTDERDEQIEEIWNREYRSAELSGGVPTTKALEQRNAEVEALTKKYASLISDADKELRKSIDKQMNEYQKQINKQVKELEKKTFKYNSVNDADNLIVYTDVYDGKAGGWPYAVYVKFLTKDLFVNGFITYDKFTGKTYNLNNNSQYNKYLEEIETYELFLSTGKALKADIEYTVEADTKQNSTYNFYINSIKISRLDNDDVIYSAEGSKLYQAMYVSTPQYDIRTLDEKDTDAKIEKTKKSIGNILDDSDIFVLPMGALSIDTNTSDEIIFSQFGVDLEYLYKLSTLQFGAGANLIIDFLKFDTGNLMDAFDINVYAAGGFRTEFTPGAYAYLNAVGGYNIAKRSFIAGIETMMNYPLGGFDIGLKISAIYNVTFNNFYMGFGLGVIF